MRRSDGYSETSARNSANVFTAGQDYIKYGFIAITVSILLHYLTMLLASDTHSSYSDYTSLSNEDQENRFDHDNSAGTIIKL